MTAPKQSKLTVDRLKQIVHYDPATGVFTRLRGTNKTVGTVVNGMGNHGYLRIFIDGERHLLHRLAWLYMTGAWPRHQIDHRDRNRANNKFDNLREATDSENNQNHSLQRNNRSGFRGVYWVSDCKKWGAFITVNRKRLHLSVYATKHEAIRARRAAERELFTFIPDAAAMRDTL